MCFYIEGDWTASVADDEIIVTDKRRRCYECRDRIHAGQECRHVWMQQYEECRLCTPDVREEWDHDWDGEELPPCKDDQHNYGETFECYICERCNTLLTAIQHVESEAGCGPGGDQPAFGELREAMWESDHAEEYVERALRDWPELAFSGHLDEFYRLTREWDELWDEGTQEVWDEDDLEPVDPAELGGEG